MKIAFDVHGVIDKYPEIIYPIIFLLREMGNRICIVSGPSVILIKKDLEKIGFYEKSGIGHFLEVYSVVDFLINSGVKTWEDDKGDIWADDQSWWNAKAKICAKNDINYIIDDSEKYKSAFDLTECQFIHIDELI